MNYMDESPSRILMIARWGIMFLSTIVLVISIATGNVSVATVFLGFSTGALLTQTLYVDLL